MRRLALMSASGSARDAGKIGPKPLADLAGLARIKT